MVVVGEDVEYVQNEKLRKGVGGTAALGKRDSGKRRTEAPEETHDRRRRQRGGGGGRKEEEEEDTAKKSGKKRGRGLGGSDEEDSKGETRKLARAHKPGQFLGKQHIRRLRHRSLAACADVSRLGAGWA